MVKRLIWDIETSPNIGLFWQPGYKVSLSYDNIIQERAIICICYKWEGDRKIHSMEWRRGNDKKLCSDFLKVALQADELIAHNGDRYDIPFFNGRCVHHGIDPAPIWKTVDTLAIARKRFRFNSNRLDYLGEFLCGDGKIKTEFGLWKDILLDNCPKSMAKMVKYCKQDVALLEKVWKKLSAYHAPKTHVGVANGLEKWTCAHCGSENVIKSKTRYTAAGTVQHQMNCKECRRYYSISNKAHDEWKEHLIDQRKDRPC